MHRHPLPLRTLCAALTVGAALALTGAAAQAGTEAFELDDARITLHLHDFLTAEELDTLRVVGTVPQALALFMGDTDGHGAIAVAPQEGFLRDGAPVDSAAARAGLPDPAAAAQAALTQCDEQRSTAQPCVVVLEIAPR